jgi:glycogen operon protein
MLAHGDEFGRSQGGNNNAYCQDNELAWVHWPKIPGGAPRPIGELPREQAEGEESAAQFLEFVRHMVWLRRDHPVFRRRRFFHGRPVSGTHDELSDIAWFTPGGEEMADEDWRASYAKSLTVFLNGYAISEPDRRGGRIIDDSFLLMFNANYEPLEFTVPINHGREWQVVVDTAQPWVVPPGTGAKVRAGDTLRLTDRSLMVLQRPA